MAKCVKLNNGKGIVRVNNKRAEKLVDSGKGTYTSKTEYRICVNVFTFLMRVAPHRFYDTI